MQPAIAVQLAAARLSAGDRVAAAAVLQQAFPPVETSTARGTWTKPRLFRVFVRDGFTDRYDGKPLVFPGALRAMSLLAPDLVPYHKNWKQDQTHAAYWSLYPTIDHVVPMARKGRDDESNVVTTSMLRNAAKSNWLLSELGWLEPNAQPADNWDGLVPWFCREFERRQELRASPALKAWYRAARSAA